jgi:hypothetical protein
VHAGDFVLALSDGVGEESTVADYVVTDQLAACFDRALGLIKVGGRDLVLRAAYLDGSFGSGKSHIMAVLYAILRGNPEARGKKGLADVVARHDSWLRGRKFLPVRYPPAGLAHAGRRHSRRLRRARDEAAPRRAAACGLPGRADRGRTRPACQGGRRPFHRPASER